MEYYAVLDIGKTRSKLQVINEQYKILIGFDRYNQVLPTKVYPSINIESIWKWFLKKIRQISLRYKISAINVSAHGATAALINEEVPLSGLVLPVMDYEWNGIVHELEYQEIRPGFGETYSPCLPTGLNLGRQLFWIEKNFPKYFNSSTAILLYPQYWVWRMTGKLLTEVTSLGCHSDLWNIKEKKYSSLVKLKKWCNKIPPLHSANDPVGYVSESFVKETGIDKDCLVYSGLHDSNASYLRYINNERKGKKVIISSGTWLVLFSPSSKLDTLLEDRDMLCNVDIYGQPIPCARFMGGREFDTICKKLKSSLKATIFETDIQQIIDNNIMALPNFSIGSGPFSGRKSKIIGEPSSGKALATLYIALMINYDLELLDSKCDIIIEGIFSKCNLLCRILAQLNLNISVFTSVDDTSTIMGAGSLCMRRSKTTEFISDTTYCVPTDLKRLSSYYSYWKELALSSIKKTP